MHHYLQIIICRVGQPPRITTIPNTLTAMQDIVGGYIAPITMAPGITLYCNEDGLDCGDIPNRVVLWGHTSTITIVGDFLLLGYTTLPDGDRHEVSLSDEDALKWLDIALTWSPAS